MRVLSALAIGLGAALAAAPALALSPQEAILLAKPAVALITARVDAEVTMNCGRGPVTVKPSPFIETGTGWFIDGKGWLITNAHVVDPTHRLPSWITHELKKKAIDQACVDPVLKAQGLMRGQKPELEDQIRRDASARALDSAQVDTFPQLTVLLSSGASLKAEVKKFSPPPALDVNGKPTSDYGRDLALLRVPDGVYPAIALSTRDTQIGDPVHILGYPGVVQQHELLNQSATVEASVTNGTVSGFKMDAIGQDLVQTDAPASHGNSGGPAVGDDAKLIGVMDFVSLSQGGGAQVQGFNFLIPARDVKTFLQGTGVKAGESTFNPVWRAGVELFLADRFKAALAKFDEANALLPNLADVKRMRADADKFIKNPPPRPFPWALATLGVSLLSVGAYGSMFARRWWKNRYRVVPAQVIGAIESGDTPVLLDVRTPTDFETSPLRLPGALRVEPDAVDKPDFTLDVAPEQMVVTYCTSPEEATSALVANKLRERGFKRVRILKGGLGGWTNARLPVESKSSLPSIGMEIYKNLTIGDVERRKFKAGEVIMKEGGDPNGEAFVIHSGVVEIRRMFDGDHRLLGTMGEGQLLGEMALFRQGARSADAIAQTDVELLVLKNERLDWLIRNRPQLTIEIIRRLSDWIVQSDRERTLTHR
ncbi:MAG TPA: cyclic nucleotide-binding domain-containing protein [Candidatus Binatia bacterium]|nr:cyclic nucleotide-binding domain-containing protein [Candidatus Binatia bacterium]